MIKLLLLLLNVSALIFYVLPSPWVCVLVCWLFVTIFPLCCLAGCCRLLVLAGCLLPCVWFCVPFLSLLRCCFIGTLFFFWPISFLSNLIMHFLSPDWEPGCARCTAGGALYVWCRHGAAGKWRVWSANTLGALLPVDVLWWQAAAEQADRGHTRKGPSSRPLWWSGNHHNHLPSPTKSHDRVMKKDFRFLFHSGSLNFSQKYVFKSFLKNNGFIHYKRFPLIFL